MLSDIKLVIFDLDGTLVDAYPAIIESFNFTMRQLKLPPRSKMTIRRAVGWGDANLLRPFLNGVSLQKALAVYRRHHRGALRDKSRLLPGVIGLLKRLKQRGLKIAVASNRPTKFSHIIIDHLGLKDYFDCVLCGDKVKHLKPSPDLLKAILKALRVRPAQALYVGDMTIDIQTGHRARVWSVAVSTGSHTKKELKNVRPYRVIDRISALTGSIYFGKNRKRMKK